MICCFKCSTFRSKQIKLFNLDQQISLMFILIFPIQSIFLKGVFHDPPTTVSDFKNEILLQLDSKVIMYQIYWEKEFKFTVYPLILSPFSFKFHLRFSLFIKCNLKASLHIFEFVIFVQNFKTSNQEYVLTLRPLSLFIKVISTIMNAKMTYLLSNSRILIPLFAFPQNIFSNENLFHHQTRMLLV